MKKVLLSVLFISMVCLSGYSQSLSLSNAGGPIVSNSTIVQAGTPDSSEMVTYLNVKNIGTAPVDVLCKKVELTMLDSTEVTICWAGGCYPPNTFVSPNSQPMAAGETNTEFVGHYTQIAFNHFKVGESIVRWVFFDRSNPNDSVSVTVKYTTYPAGVEESVASRGVLTSPYPNPASADACCEYAIPAGSQGTIVVRDLLGATVQTHLLPASNGRATINTSNLGNGIYFCSLMVDGKISQTKKLVVRH